MTRLPTMGNLARNTMLGSIWQLLRVGLQMLTAVVVARLLGPGNFGLLAGVNGLATAIGGLAGLGTAYLLLQAVSRDPTSFGAYWRKSTWTTAVSGIFLAGLFVLVASAIITTPVSLSVLVGISISELVAYPLILVASLAFQAHERLGWTSALLAGLAAVRFFSAIALWSFSSHADLQTYVLWYAIASLGMAAIALAWARHVLKPPRAKYSLARSELIEGLGFSSLWFTNSGMTELDKTLALRFLGAEFAGLYSVAYRMANALMMPFGALVLAAQPRLFRQGADAPPVRTELVEKLALSALLNGAFAGAVLYFAGDVLPWLLGPGFAGAANAARLLALWPLVYAARLLAGTLLVTRGHRAWRAVAECLSIAALIIVSAIIMPRFGLAGAAGAVTGTETLLALAMWFLVSRTRRRQNS